MHNHRHDTFRNKVLMQGLSRENTPREHKCVIAPLCVQWMQEIRHLRIRWGVQQFPSQFATMSCLKTLQMPLRRVLIITLFWHKGMLPSYLVVPQDLCNYPERLMTPWWYMDSFSLSNSCIIPTLTNRTVLDLTCYLSVESFPIIPKRCTELHQFWDKLSSN